MKRTPLARKPFARRTPSELPVRLGFGVGAALGGREAGIPAPKPRKDTGPDRRTRGLVLARDNFQCVACGKPVGGACTWWSLQHRLARGQGGGNELWNLILLCGSATSEGCHLRCEQRDREMQARGYWLESWQDPRTEPVMIVGEDGGVTVWLDDSGNYLDEDGNVITAPREAA